MAKKIKKKKAVKRVTTTKSKPKDFNVFESKTMRMLGVILSGLTIISVIMTYVYYSAITGMFNTQNIMSLLALVFPMYVIYFSIIKPAKTSNTQILYWLSITIMLIIIMLFISAIFKGNFCYWFTSTCAKW